MAKFCSQCGSPLNEGTVFCSSCGIKVGDIKAKTSIVAEAVPLRNKTALITKEELIIAFSGLAVIVIMLFFVFYKSSPETTIEKFEKAYNNVDVDSMMECMEPQAQAIFKGTTALLSGVSGFEVDDILSGAIGIYNYYTDDSVKPHVNFDVTNVEETNDTSAEVYVNYSYYTGEGTETGSTVLSMVRIEGKWYIAMDSY